MNLKSMTVLLYHFFPQYRQLLLQITIFVEIGSILTKGCKYDASVEYKPD